MNQNTTRTTTEREPVKVGPCDCSPEAEQWELEESPLDGDDEIGFYRCQTCGTLHCIDGTPENV